MSAPRFYCDLPLLPGETVSLPPAVVRHAAQVLRCREGETLTLFNGHGAEYEALLVSVSRSAMTARIVAAHRPERESPLNIHLLQSLQGSDKMDFTFQKAVELGVVALHPLSTRRSLLKLSGERAERRCQHWAGVVIAACEQCGRNWVPPVHDLESLPNYLAKPGRVGAQRLLLAPGAKTVLRDLPMAREVDVLVGPEGGLEAGEIELAQQAGFTPIQLGPRILRTETAGLAVVAALQTLWGDWGGR